MPSTFLKVKKRRSKAVKTVPSTSQVLVVDEVLSNNEPKPEKALRRSSCIKCFKLCCYSFWQRLPRNTGCAKPTPYIWSSARA
jgi:hypothetical protein